MQNLIFCTVQTVTVYCKSKKLTSGFTTSKLVSYDTYLTLQYITFQNGQAYLKVYLTI